jgi:hypothetical protein
VVDAATGDLLRCWRTPAVSCASDCVAFVRRRAADGAQDVVLCQAMPKGNVVGAVEEPEVGAEA